MTLRALLVDDEPLARARLRDLLAEAPGVEVLGECGSGLEALDAVRRLRPDLLFLDIQMPGLDGFEVLEALGEEAPWVVFATAYDRFALKAFEARAVDYLLKPFSGARLRQAVARVQDAAGAAGARERLRGLLQDLEARRRERFVVRQGDRFRVLRADQVDAVEAEANYMWVHLGREAFAMRTTLAALARGLDPARFLRAHRSWLVNLERVRELRPASGGGLVAVTEGGVQVPVSPAHRDALEAGLVRLHGAG